MENDIRELDYQDKKFIKIYFTVLIIRVESINKKFGSLHDFVNRYDLCGYTNGKLFWLNEMMQPPPYLYSIIDDILTPLGFKEKNDFVLTFERLVRSDRDTEEGSLLGKVIPECLNVDWLGSIITKRGNFIWHRPEHKRTNDTKYFKIPRQGDNEAIINYKEDFEKYTLERLVEAYNHQARMGIVGVHQQALYLIALRKEFLERLEDSSINLQEYILGMKGQICLINGKIMMVG
jgi:hypothetical protein